MISVGDERNKYFCVGVSCVEIIRSFWLAGKVTKKSLDGDRRTKEFRKARKDGAVDVRRQARIF